MQASAAAQVHPNVLHPIYKEFWRDMATKYGCVNELGISLVDSEGQCDQVGNVDPPKK